MRPVIFYGFLVFIISCAQKVSTPEESSYFYSEASEQKNHYMLCNHFSDNTFQGSLYNSSKENCMVLDIINNPKELLKNNDFFLQIYPFTVSNEELSYGDSVPIYTIQKNEQETLMKSYIIDTHIIKVQLEVDEDSFFKDHNFEICDLDEKWDGLQMVIYERRKHQEDPTPIRISKMLKPPFLIHPEYFREEKGDILTGYHPFLDYIPEYKSNPNGFYNLAENVCSDLTK